MTWNPWTRIRELERERDRADVLLTAMVERADNAEAEVRRLTDIIVSMRRDGFNPPTAAPAAQPVETVPDKVLQALISRAKPGTDLYREMYADAMTMVQAGRDVDEIANEIYEGGGE